MYFRKISTTLVFFLAITVPGLTHAQYFDDQLVSNGSYYDDAAQPVGAGNYYDDAAQMPSGTYYDDQPATGSYYDDAPLSSPSGQYIDDSGTYYDDQLVSGADLAGTYYDDVLTNGGTYYDDALVSDPGSYYDDSLVSNPSYFNGVDNGGCYSCGGGNVDSYMQDRSYVGGMYAGSAYSQMSGGYMQSSGYSQSGGYQQSYGNMGSASGGYGYAMQQQSSFIQTAQPQYVTAPVQYAAVPMPTCTLTMKIESDGIAWVSWISQGATYGVMSHGLGKVAATGGTWLYPQVGQNYVLVVYGPTGQGRCEVVMPKQASTQKWWMGWWNW